MVAVPSRPTTCVLTEGTQVFAVYAVASSGVQYPSLQHQLFQIEWALLMLSYSGVELLQIGQEIVNKLLPSILNVMWGVPPQSQSWSFMSHLWGNLLILTYTLVLSHTTINTKKIQCSIVPSRRMDCVWIALTWWKMAITKLTFAKTVRNALRGLGGVNLIERNRNVIIVIHRQWRRGNKSQQSFIK